MVEIKRNGPYGGPQITWVNIIATLALLATIAGGAWILFQNQFSSLEGQMQARFAAVASDIRDNRTEVDRLRDTSIGRREHDEFVKRIDERMTEAFERLQYIQRTHPTTQELENVANGTKEEINILRETLKELRERIDKTK